LTKKVIIRKAVENDLDTLLRFEQGVVTTELSFDPTLKRGPNHYYDLKQMINDPCVQLVVAECEGELIGCGYARVEKAKPYLKHDLHAYLGFMYVDPAWRGKNINQMIIESLGQWSVSKGITELRLEVYYDNLPAIKAYEKAGFSKLMIQMRMNMKKD
jgi:GNAT superfamily N-acetyltransferase